MSSDPAPSPKKFNPRFKQIDPKEMTTIVRKRLIVCCDGTWFASDKGGKNLPSNVARIGRLIASEGSGETNSTGQPPKIVQVPQIIYYQSGVGTGDLTWVDKRVQGAFGQNLDENVCSAYTFLCNNYAVGDEIFLFGFSRGAYTARSLAGLVLAAGIIPPGSLGGFFGMYQAYKSKGEQKFQKTEWWGANSEKLGIHFKHVNIKFLGVWDTVGALGLPDSFISRALNNSKGYEFHDTELSDGIQRAAQALALDEYRGTFSPTLWFHQGIQHMTSELIQCWFPGYHAHIGGGTVEDYLDESSIDDITLAWMVDQTKDFLNYDNVEIERFIEQQNHKKDKEVKEVKKDEKDPKHHKWGEGTLTDSASYAFLIPGAGGWKTRTPGEYYEGGKEGSTEGNGIFNPKPHSSTEEYIHPSVRYRMGLMEQKPKKLGKINGWVSGNTPITKYEPAALKGFEPILVKGNTNTHLWRKPGQGNRGEVLIKEYRVPPTWNSTILNEGLERKIIPEIIMEELDFTNNYGKDGPLRPHSSEVQTQVGVQPGYLFSQG